MTEGEGSIYRIRFHGRGGQGMKTASRVLGSALFHDGFEVQDAPRYGAERRGAPIFAYVRASRLPIHERGIIAEPDLVIVADDTLMQVPAAGIRTGLDAHAVLLMRTGDAAETWRARMGLAGEILTLPVDADGSSHRERLVGAQCTGAAARLLGVVTRAALERAVADELGALGAETVTRNVEVALASYDAMAPNHGRVRPRAVAKRPATRADWVTLPFEGADISAPSIHGAATSVEVRTGLWRTMRPIIDHSRCHRCHWMCALPCPDGAMPVDAEGYPHIDLEHCKGCLVCVAQCPFHVIAAVPEELARQGDAT